MAKAKKIVEVAEEILNGFLSENDLIIYDAEYVKEGHDRVLRVYIDKEEGYVGTEDCEKVSRFLSDKMDELDPIEENYVLEVSSPGLDRELRKDEHFAKYIGELVEVSLYKAIDGEKKLKGKLKSRDDAGLKIDVDGKEITIDKEQITKVNLAVTI
ncbi:MAG: ribosome maturation factor RimP [Firmicutes bacterium]|nr:ribosome maturation factor RimP [Bacillota bacterium]